MQPLSHSGLVTLTNVTAQMAPASLAIDDSSPPILSTLNSPPPSSVTSEQTDIQVPPTATGPEQAFPEYPNGNVTIQLRAHAQDDFMSTGWATCHIGKLLVVRPDSINVWELWCVQIPFLKNAHSSCYASAPFFIIHKMLENAHMQTVLQKIDSIPPNIGYLIQLCDLIKQQKFTTCRQKLMAYIWNHKDGAKRGKTMSWTKFVHVYFENHPSLHFSTPSQQSIFRNITGITFLHHTLCMKCNYTNKIVYNSMVDIGLDQLKQLDLPKNIAPDLETLLNYRHHHVHEESVCPTCRQQRKHWFSIVHISPILFINLESLVPVKPSITVAQMIVPLTMQVDSTNQRIRLKMIGTINYAPGHWTSSVLNNANSTYEYDDLDGVAYLKPLSDSGFSNKSTGGVVYIRDDDYVVTRSRYGIGDNVEILNQLCEPVGIGTVEELFPNDILMVKVLQVNPEEKQELFFGPHRDITTVQQCLNQIVVWHSSLLNWSRRHSYQEKHTSGRSTQWMMVAPHRPAFMI